MAMKTPFFSAFGPLLFGRRRHRATPVIEEDFNAFQSVLSGHIPRESLAAPAIGAHSRRRDWSLEVTFWAFLYQVLGPACACREVVRKVQAWSRQRRRRAISGDTGAYCLARAKLPLSLLGKIFSELAATLERRMCEGERWLGERRVKILDGTGLSMPDTPANQRQWPQPGGQKPGCGFPLLRMAGLFCLGSGALLRYAFGSKHDQENWLCRGVLGGLEEGDVLLADRGFCSYGLIGVMLARGVDCVMRLHQARPRDFRRGKRLGKDDRLVIWRKDKPRKNDPWGAEHSALPATLAVRLVRFRVEVPGFRTEQIFLATTLLAPAEYPVEILADLYRARWNIELRHRDIKTTMGAEVLRCKSPAMIERELCMNAIGYNLIRCVMQEAAQTHGVELARISFKGTLDTVRHFADALHAAAGQPRKQRQLYDEMLAIIAKDTLPWRPERIEPRARKRRPKPYQLLTKPRHQMRVIPHRNRSRATDANGLN